MSYLRGNSVVDGNLYVEGDLYVRTVRPDIDSEGSLAYITAGNGDVEGRHLRVLSPADGTLRNSSFVEKTDDNNNVTLKVVLLNNSSADASSFKIDFPINKISVDTTNIGFKAYKLNGTELVELGENDSKFLIKSWAYTAANN